MKTFRDVFFSLLAGAILIGLAARVREPAYRQIKELHERAEAAVRFDNVDDMTRSLAATKFFSMGFKEVIADYLWIKAVTFKAVEEMENLNLGDSEREFHVKLEALPYTEADYHKLYRLVTQAAFFDPHFIYAYQYGSLLLAWNGQVDLSNTLLRRGLRNNPGEWRLASSLAFNNYFFLQDYEAAVHWASRYGEMTGEPDVSLLAQLYTLNKKYDMALKILTEMAEKTQSPRVREIIEEKIKHIQVESDLYHLEDAVKQMVFRVGRRPTSLEELVRADLIRYIPREPFGGRYVLDASLRVRNEPYRRLKVMERMEGGRGSDEERGETKDPHDHEGHDHE